MSPYHRPIDVPFELPTKIYGGMLAIWLLRPNLQRRFPLHKNKRSDYIGFLAWCTMIGRRECKLLTEIKEWEYELNQPAKLPTLKGDKWDETFTVGMYLVGIHRGKYWHSQILGNKTLRHRTARWYFREGRELLALERVAPWQIKSIINNYKTYNNFISNIQLPKDNKATLDLINKRNFFFKGFFEKEIASDTFKNTSLKLKKNLQTLVAGLLPIEFNELFGFFQKNDLKPTTAQVTEVVRGLNKQLECYNIEQKEQNKPFGVNLYGYANGELGIGEDVRMLALAFEAANVPFCIINIKLGDDVSQNDHSADAWLVSEPKYHFNIFCMTGIEMCRLVSHKGTGFLTKHYNIGLWPWELPAWPEAWQHAWALVDELWGISQFTANAYAKAPVPVIAMPLPVVVKKVAPLKRSHWELPGQAYLFAYSFDVNSRSTRKNPAAVIQAFKKAAQGYNADEAGLVLKVSHLKPNNLEWKNLKELIADDPRIHLIKTELRRPEVLALYQNCDCYVSLHRSEGFGRALAEAQLLGIELIATGYSGNMEFCNQSPTACVDYHLVDLQPNDYFYGDGQQWAEPNSKHAALLMKQKLETGRVKKHIEYNTVQFSPESCGKIFKKRLELIISSVEKEILGHE